jgi:hypothetical protein
MPQQLTIFNAASANRLAVVGMNMAVDHADQVREKWRHDCWKLFWQWLNKKPRYFEFQVEDFREYLQDYDLLEMPPSNRAFAFLVEKAKERSLIQYSGRDEKTRNKKAHGAKAAVWVKI